MRINQARRFLAKTNILLGDVQAVKRGRYAQRVHNRILGRLANRVMRRLWR